jgi:uncharacterized membrane protein
MQCPVCHNEVGAQSAFCGHCGASIATAAEAVPPPSDYGSGAATYPAATASSSGITPNTAAALSYVTIIPAILFLIVEPYNRVPLVRFHAFQSIGLAVAWFAVWMVFLILSMFIAMVPGLRLILFMFPVFQMVVGLGFFALWIVTILKASKGEWFKLPIIGDFAMKQAQS